MRPGPGAFLRQREQHHMVRKLQKVQTEIEVRKQEKKKTERGKKTWWSMQRRRWKSSKALYISFPVSVLSVSVFLSLLNKKMHFAPTKAEICDLRQTNQSSQFTKCSRLVLETTILLAFWPMRVNKKLKATTMLQPLAWCGRLKKICLWEKNKDL